MNWNTLPDKEIVEKTAEALTANGMKTIVVENGDKAKEEVLKIIPEGAEVMTATSETTKQIGLSEILDESGKYQSIRKKINSLPESKQRMEMRRMSALSDYVVGSVHAVTQKGEVLIASFSGSQLPLYAFSAAHVVWVVGTQKIVTDTDEGTKRIYDYVLGLESERMQKAYGMGSAVSKLLIINKEVVPERITVILINQELGF